MIFGDDSDSILSPNTQYTFWDSEVGGAQVSSLTYFKTGASASRITTRSDGSFPMFNETSGTYSELWADSGGGQRLKIYADPSTAFTTAAQVAAAIATQHTTDLTLFTPLSTNVAANDKTGWYVPKDWGQWWRPKLTAARAGSGLATLGVVGTSIDEEVHYPSVSSKAWMGLLRARLVGTLLGAADGGSGFHGISYTQQYQTAFGFSSYSSLYSTDAKFVAQTGSWSTAFGLVAGPTGQTLNSNISGATLTFKVRGRFLDVKYMKWLAGSGSSQTGGTFTVTVDGTVLATLSCDNGASASATTVSTVDMTTDAAHTVVLTSTVSPSNASIWIFIHGVTARNATGVLVNNYARGGATSAVFAATSTAGNVIDWSGGSHDPCDLAVLALMVNDANASTSVATWANNVLAALNGLKAGSSGKTDLLIKVDHIGTYATQAFYATYVQELRGIAEGWGAALLDMNAIGQNNYAYMTALNYWGSNTSPGSAGADVIHPSDAGHALIDAQVGPFLAAVA